MAKCGTRTLYGCARWWCLLVAVGLGWGCSGQSDATKRQLELLNERVLILQNDRDRLVERVDALEQHTVAAPPSVAMAQPHARPRLKVVHLAPDNTVSEERTSDDGDNAASEASVPDGEKAEASSDTGDALPNVAQRDTNLEQERVVLYGEGQSSGVRQPSSQELR